MSELKTCICNIPEGTPKNKTNDRKHFFKAYNKRVSNPKEYQKKYVPKTERDRFDYLMPIYNLQYKTNRNKEKVKEGDKGDMIWINREIEKNKKEAEYNKILMLENLREKIKENLRGEPPNIDDEVEFKKFIYGKIPDINKKDSQTLWNHFQTLDERPMNEKFSEWLNDDDEEVGEYKEEKEKKEQKEKKGDFIDIDINDRNYDPRAGYSALTSLEEKIRREARELQKKILEKIKQHLESILEKDSLVIELLKIINDLVKAVPTLNEKTETEDVSGINNTIQMIDNKSDIRQENEVELIKSIFESIGDDEELKKYIELIKIYERQQYPPGDSRRVVDKINRFTIFQLLLFLLPIRERTTTKVLRGSDIREEGERKNGGGKKTKKRININPKMRGVFTRKAKRNKMSVQKYATYIIKKYKGKTRNKRQLKLLRQAVFAKTAKKWKKKRTRRRKKFRKKFRK